MRRCQCGYCGGAEGHIKSITYKIKLAIGDENNDYAACKLNVNSEVRAISKSLSQENISAKVMGAIYHIDTGIVEFIED